MIQVDRSERGSVFVEAVIVIPMLIAAGMIVFAVGFAMRLANVSVEASRYGARAAAVQFAGYASNGDPTQLTFLKSAAEDAAEQFIAAELGTYTSGNWTITSEVAGVSEDATISRGGNFGVIRLTVQSNILATLANVIPSGFIFLPQMLGTSGFVLQGYEV